MADIKQLQEKWAPVLNHEALPEIEDSYKKGVVAQLLENQEKAAKKERRRRKRRRKERKKERRRKERRKKKERKKNNINISYSKSGSN